MDFHIPLMLGTLLLILCVILLRIVYSVWWKPKTLERYFRHRGIKGTSYKPMYGDIRYFKNLMSEAKSKPMPLTHAIVPRVRPEWYQMVRNYGKISVSWHERRANMLVADATLMKHILNDKNGSFQKPPTNPLVQLLTLGVSTLEGSHWDKRRKLINPAFHHDKLLGMIPTFLTSCCNLVQRWKDQIGDCNGTFELDIAPEMQQLASDIIARAAFGTTFDEAKAIFELQEEQVLLVLDAFFDLYLPGLRFLPSKKNRRRYEIDRKIKAKLNDMIIDKEKKMQKNDADGNKDLLSLLLKCQKQTNNDMTIDDVMEECKLFYLAGQETTATWLTWTMIVLSMHPDWQDKAREEVLQVFGKSIPDAKNLNQLKIVSMVLLEVMRLYPAVTGLQRHTIKSTKIGDAMIPRGVDIILPILLLHHDPEYWGEDVEDFKPERFAEGVSKAAARDDQETAFYPFGWGPRICLGQTFAVMEAKLALTMILQHFSFGLSPTYTHAPHVVITLRPQFGAPLILHKI